MINNIDIMSRSEPKQKPTFEQFFNAVQNGSIKDVTTLFETMQTERTGFDKDTLVNSNYNGVPLILYAAMNNKFDIVNFLINNGANPMVQDIYKNTIAHWAEINSNITAANILYENYPELQDTINEIEIKPIQFRENREEQILRMWSNMVHNSVDIIQEIIEETKEDKKIKNKFKNMIDALKNAIITISKKSNKYTKKVRKPYPELPPPPPTTGGATHVTYKGRKYKVRVGNKGGRYILVGADKKKVYVKN